MNSFNDLEQVAITFDLLQFGLREGDIGTVVDVFGDDAVMVEFLDRDGSVIALLSMSPIDLRRPSRQELASRLGPEPLPPGSHVFIAEAGPRPEPVAPPPPPAPPALGQRLSHIDDAGQARMVDVTAKDETLRVAEAQGRIVMQAETLRLLLAGEIAKGNVLTTAQVAGIMAAKRTHELIPMCHPLLLTGIDVELTPDRAASTVEIRATVRTTGKTGVEMEALTAVTVAGLTVYDMCKAVDRGMRLQDVRLSSKSGGASGDFRAE
jgi:cyclic pyranopterin phosphate synthase